MGPVMWVLGGLLARDMAGDENKILEEDMFAEQDGNDNDETMHPHGEGEEACEELDRGASASHCSGEMRPLEMPPHSQPNPSIRISEPQQEQTLLHSATNNSSGESQCASSASSEEEHDETSWRESAPGQEALFRRKSRRKMSWADESGQSLDDYYQEVRGKDWIEFDSIRSSHGGWVACLAFLEGSFVGMPHLQPCTFYGGGRNFEISPQRPFQGTCAASSWNVARRIGPPSASTSVTRRDAM